MSTILLVDDEPEMLELFSEILEMMDCSVIQAHDGQEALAMARAQPPDLVVTDWMMPRMTGLELCHRLRHDESLRDVPIIMHSSSGDPHDPDLHAFVPKDCSLEEFEDVVYRFLPQEEAAHA
jgi:CheY-like chemotaxis protein